MGRVRFWLIALAVVMVVVFLVTRFSRSPESTPLPTSVPTRAATAVPTAGTPPQGDAPAVATPGTPTARGPSGMATTNLLRAYFFDVGQGDSILLKGPDFTILIDAGRHERNDVVPYLEGVGITSIDVLIGTHPHADHIGQFAQVLERFPVSEVWMSGDTNTTRTFEEAIDAIADSGAAYHEPRAGEVYQIGSARVEVLNPQRLSGDVNEGSVSVRVVFGSVAFMLTGDAEEPTEAAIVARGGDLHAQILKLGHHGSDTSSSPAFLEAVQPEVAIWSAATDNTYGHPKAEVIERLERMGVRVFGTAINSTIIVTTDGEHYEVAAEVGGSDAIFVPPTPVAASPAVHAINRNANLRVGPGSDFEIVEQLDAGTVVVPRARNEIGDWIFVQAPSGSLGWIFRPFITNLASEMLPLRATPTPTPIAGGCAVGQVNINTASTRELQDISQVGPARAREIVQLRPFDSLDDLARVDGIAEGTVAIIEAQGLACVE